MKIKKNHKRIKHKKIKRMRIKLDKKIKWNKMPRKEIEKQFKPQKTSEAK
jgi:hypothetical protein